jgi:hypothetical protein
MATSAISCLLPTIIISQSIATIGGMGAGTTVIGVTCLGAVG